MTCGTCQGEGKVKVRVTYASEYDKRYGQQEEREETCSTCGGSGKV